REMKSRPKTSPCRMVVIDTLTHNFSLELPGRPNLASRQEGLSIHLSEIARDAFLNARTYLLINRVTFGPSEDVGVGGKTVEQLVGVTLRFDRRGDEVRITRVNDGIVGSTKIGARGLD